MTERGFTPEDLKEIFLFAARTSYPSNYQIHFSLNKIEVFDEKKKLIKSLARFEGQNLIEI